MDDTVELVFNKFLTLFRRFILQKADHEDQFETRGVDKLRSIVKRCVENHSPIRMVLPGFPHKNPVVGRCLGHVADGAEESALEILHSLCADVEEFYAPGCELLVLSDGRVWARLTNVPRTHYERYAETVRAINKQVHLASIKSYRSSSHSKSNTSLEGEYDSVNEEDGSQSKVPMSPVMFASLDAYLKLSTEEGVDQALENAFGMDRGYFAKGITPTPSPFPVSWPWSSSGLTIDNSTINTSDECKQYDGNELATDSIAVSPASPSQVSSSSSNYSQLSAVSSLCLDLDGISIAARQFLQSLPPMPKTAMSYLRAMFSLIGAESDLTFPTKTELYFGDTCDSATVLASTTHPEETPTIPTTYVDSNSTYESRPHPDVVDEESAASSYGHVVNTSPNAASQCNSFSQSMVCFSSTSCSKSSQIDFSSVHSKQTTTSLKASMIRPVKTIDPNASQQLFAPTTENLDEARNLKSKFDHMLRLAIATTRETLGTHLVTGDEIQYSSRVLALAMLYRSISFASFISLQFSGMIILSVHATVNSGPKYTVNLFPMRLNQHRMNQELTSILDPALCDRMVKHSLIAKPIAPYHCVRAVDIYGRALPLTLEQGKMFQTWIQTAVVKVFENQTDPPLKVSQLLMQTRPDQEGQKNISSTDIGKVIEAFSTMFEYLSTDPRDYLRDEIIMIQAQLDLVNPSPRHVSARPESDSSPSSPIYRFISLDLDNMGFTLQCRKLRSLKDIVMRPLPGEP